MPGSFTGFGNRRSFTPTIPGPWLRWAMTGRKDDCSDEQFKQTVHSVAILATWQLSKSGRSLTGGCGSLGNRRFR